MKEILRGTEDYIIFSEFEKRWGMSVSQAAPSPFAALLRRSKFASYDPLIGQVYTTHGGHAHRGNWGLKRPLPNRRRGGFITVRSVDSPEQQTEWNSAESSARWLRRWEELGKKLEVEELGTWTHYQYSWAIDTEFDRAEKDGRQPGRERQREGAVSLSDESSLVPNPETMSPKRFKKYLNHLRALRPEFKEFLQDAWHKTQALQNQKGRKGPKLESEQKAMKAFKLTGSGEIDMFASAQNAGNMFVNDFLKHRAINTLRSLESKRVEARPHHFAGLQYSFVSALQTQYLHKPAPGRDVAQSRASRYVNSKQEKKTEIIAVGGILGELKEDGAQTIIPTDFGTREAPRQNREQGKGVFLMNAVKLLRAPSTVGRVPEKAGDAKFVSIEFCTSQLASANSSNPHHPGSLDYVGCEDINQSKGGAAVIPNQYNRNVKATADFRARTIGKDGESPLLGTLEVMILQKKS